MRPHQQTAAGNRADSAGQLNRSHGHGSLADADGNGLARVPFLFEVAHLPFFRRHHAADFLRQVDTGFLSQAKQGRVFRNAIDAKFLGEGVKENVAGLVDRLADFDHAVGAMLRRYPAFEVASVEGGAAVADHVHVLRDALLQARRGHDDLESRTGCELSLDGFVQQRDDLRR